MQFPLRQSSSSFWSDRQIMGSSRCRALPVQSSVLKLTMRASGCCASTSRTRQVIPFPVRSSEAPLAEAETRGDLRQLTPPPPSRPRQPSLGVRGVRGEGNAPAGALLAIGAVWWQTRRRGAEISERYVQGHDVKSNLATYGKRRAFTRKPTSATSYAQCVAALTSGSSASWRARPPWRRSQRE